MGGKEPEPEIQETALSREQFKILEAREKFYQETTRPEMKDYFQQTKEFQLNSDLQSLNPEDARAVTGRVFDNQQSQLEQTLGERGFSQGVADEQFGAQRGIAEGGAFNSALMQSILQNNTNLQQINSNKVNEAGIRQGGMNMMLSQSPQATQAAPLFFHKTAPKVGMVAQIGQSIMGAMGSMGSMPGMGGGGGGGGQGGGLSAPSGQISGGQSSMMA